MRRITFIILAVTLVCPALPTPNVSASCNDAPESTRSGCCGENCQCGDSCQCGRPTAPKPTDEAPAPVNETSVELQRILDCSADLDILDEVQPESHFERETDSAIAITLTSQQLCSLLGRYLL